MMARSHLLGGTAIAGALVSTTWMLSRPERTVTAWLDQAAASAGAGPGFISSAASRVLEQVVPSWYLLPVAAALLLVGTLLPDIDSSSSRLGRWVPTPGPHRGITHSDLVTWALLVLSVLEPSGLLIWLTLGYWSHLELDGLSRAGRARFYPLGKHKTVRLADGERLVVRTGGWRGLYKAGKPSERRVLVGVVVACAMVCVAALLV